jgi:hypothetical protein
MKTNITLGLEFGLCNGSMTIEIYQDELLIKKLENITTTTNNVSLKIDFPSQLKIVLSNKNHNTDTILDNNGSIINDKYVILKHLTVGTIPIKIDVLFRLCQYYKNQNNNPVNDTYWGFNGVAIIDFNSDNFIKWCLKHNNTFDF